METMEMDSLDQFLSQLITAFHILHQHEVIDEHGQISVRNPRDPSTFFTSSRPAILVSSKSDLEQWHVFDGTPVRNPYAGCRKVESVPEQSEHYTHSSIYFRYPGVRSIIHSHCRAAIIYGLCDSEVSMLQPSYLMAGFLGPSPPIFDPSKYYDALPPSQPQNLMVNCQYLGDALAEALYRGRDGEMRLDGVSSHDLPRHKVIFQRGHGYTVWAESVEDAVWRAIHVRRDADIQTAAVMQRATSEQNIVYLSGKEAVDCDRTINHATYEQWLAWTVAAERSGLYRNLLRPT
ncbi:hypothetical protein A1O7_08279 [Cladophialophora yegresii CBS 114405]|uniref:Class II aldolase/adducin N-terminal domain-containing protein n=1 Tax=Cladophialophora yegresii CBS 114405 TaxID=1182544 RepID=W9VI92_9EURO|nr:uncharacterized protein A1O7_08279 [Cladophialophora yegresii CBS 114405]EXJ55352.1 hypothetical protein A1O7_08279 [Cladophialophora yegresii CBS 114405]